MDTRKELKARAKRVLKNHYWLLVVTCILAAFTGSELSSSVSFLSQNLDTSSIKQSFQTPISAVYQGDIESARKMTQNIKDEKIKESEANNTIWGRSHGVLAGIANDITSGGIIVTAISAITKIGVSTNAAIVVLIIFALGLVFAVWFFILNVGKAVVRRIFLECRVYEDVPAQRFLFLVKVKRWIKASCTMFMTTIFFYLWLLTIVGGFIKYYSYAMVPYIVAENPDISWRDAIKLSRKMMDGHKWDLFVLDVSFIPWKCLSLLTMGIGGILFVSPYFIATRTEWFVCLRQTCKAQNMPGTELLNDRYLYEIADAAFLQQTYQDLLDIKINDVLANEKGWKHFLAVNFGISVYNESQKKNYREYEKQKMLLQSANMVVAGMTYPTRLYPIAENVTKKKRTILQIDFMRCYSIPNLILLFFVFSITGWVWEMIVHLVLDGVFVNRGILHGPWVPIYGSGGVLVLVLLKKYRDRPLLECFSIIITCGLIEYFTGYLMEITHGGARWWDYSGYFLNIQGRVCAEGLLTFALGGMAFVYIGAPLVDNILRKIKWKYAVTICIILVMIFIGDFIYSMKVPNVGAGVTYDRNGQPLETIQAK